VTISIVQSVHGTGTGISFGTATTAGNCVIVLLGDHGATSAPSVTGVTLGGLAGNFAALATAVKATSPFQFATAWADPSCAGGQTAIAVTESNGNAPVIYAFEVAGLAAASVLDQSSTATLAGTSWSSGSTPATAQAAELWIGLAAYAANTTLTGPGGAWSNTVQNNSTTVHAIAGTQITASTGAAVYSGTSTLNSSYAALVVTLVPALPPLAPFPAGRGRPAAVRGHGIASRGAPVTANAPTTPSAFPQPRPSRGRAAAVRGRTASSRGAPVTTGPPVPSPFPQPPPSRGRVPVRGRGTGSRGSPVSLPVPSPFPQPRPSRGRAAAVRGRSKTSSGSPVKAAPPPSPGALIVSIASAAGTDDYGNAFPQGILATKGLIQGPQVVIAGANGELLVYSPAGGAGNLIASIAGQAGTDQYGNSFLTGVSSYLVLGTALALQINGVIVTYYQAATQAGPYTSFAEIGTGSNGPSFQPGIEIQQTVLLDPVGSAPPTPAAGCVLWYQPGSPGILWAKGPSGTASLLANT
jgi:hypothetical protein